MKYIKRHLVLFVLAFCCSCADLACMDQYKPQAFWDQLKKEEKIANKPSPALTKDGKLKESL